MEYEYITTIPGTDRDIPVPIYEEKRDKDKDKDEDDRGDKTFCQKNPEYRCEIAKALNSCGNCRGR